MSYPYPHRNRAHNMDHIELHKRGTDSGTAVSVTSSGTEVLSDSTDVNLPYNEWNVHGVFWVNNTDQDLSIKVVPYVDHGQTVDGPAFFMAQPGSTAAASSITVSATATGTDGVIFHVLGGLSGGGATTEQFDGLSPVHGMKVVISSTAAITNTGATMDWELVCCPRS